MKRLKAAPALVNSGEYNDDENYFLLDKELEPNKFYLFKIYLKDSDLTFTSVVYLTDEQETELVTMYNAAADASTCLYMNRDFRKYLNSSNGDAFTAEHATIYIYELDI